MARAGCRNMNSITVAVQSPYGTKRVQVSRSGSAISLKEKILKEFDIAEPESWSVYVDKAKTRRLEGRRTIEQLGVEHGHRLLLHNDVVGSARVGNEAEPVPNIQGTGTSGPVAMEIGDGNHRGAEGNENVGPRVRVPSPAEPQLDEIDELLDQKDGKIERPPNPILCRHTSRTGCMHCFPWDVSLLVEKCKGRPGSIMQSYEEDYLDQENIKHMSFHSYVRKLTTAPGRSSSIKPLENINCTIKHGCKSHRGGRCPKCQPGALTLTRQIYRHVDNISFENGALVERFLGFWRRGGNQRIGFLFGRYEFHPPLGIKAVVSAIYEPAQLSGPSSVQLLEEDPKRTKVNQLAEALGLTCVGWIFTDLVAMGNGLVECTRNAESYLLSAEECITAGYFQSIHPNPCKYATEGHFGSKFVTVIVTGDQTNHVHFEGYQVSNQCTALVKGECLVPTKDAPELAYVPESTTEQFVPDVYFTEKDQYGNQVKKDGRPLPVEYLIVDVPTGVPVEPLYTFYVSENKTPFPIENRGQIDEKQTFDALATYARQFANDSGTPQERFYNFVSDFHLLLCLLDNDFYQVNMDQIRDLLAALKAKDVDAVFLWYNKEPWATLQQMIEAHQPNVNGVSENEGGGGGVQWACPHCTLDNPPDRNECGACALPRFP